ncbi:MAG: phage minor capsid protein, partial [Acidimicrobiales bacterium]
QGRDLVIVSDAPEECPLCRPWEGKVLSTTGSTPAGAVVGGRTVAGTLDRARGEGLFHPNCRHSVGAWVPGITMGPPGPSSDPEGNRLRNRQRALERNVRAAKRRLAAVEPFNDPVLTRRARGQVAGAQANVRAFVNQHNRKRLYYREQPAMI